MITDPPFRRVGIVGLGLIGGSIAQGVRQTWPAVTTIGVDHPKIAADARDRGVIAEARPAIEELADSDLVILAAPVPDIIELIDRADRARLQAVITHVG